jgi:hypothetical protein
VEVRNSVAAGEGGVDGVGCRDGGELGHRVVHQAVKMDVGGEEVGVEVLGVRGSGLQ